MWNEYVFGKQTLRELSEKSKLTKLAIKNNFSKIKLPKKDHHPRLIYALVDCTFFGDKEHGQWGVLVFRDALSGEDLWWKFIEEERLEDYKEGFKYLSDLGYKFLSVTCDGFRGLINVFQGIPVQFCHFHQKQIIRRYVTKNPKLQAGIDLKELVEMLGEIPSEEFKQYLQAYLNYYRDFLSEKTIDPITKKSHFIHQRLRSAIRSLLTNFNHLFIYEKYPQLQISITNNAIESHFSHIKTLTRIHRGLKRKMKQKFIETLLLNSSIVKEKA